MAEIINLRQARKGRKRSEKEAAAAENRAKFGRPGEERRLEEARKALEGRRLDGHRLEDDGSA